MNWKCNPDDLIRLVHRFPEVSVLIVGDLMLDRYLRGKVERISPEAPVPVVHIQEEEERAGGAANVARNVAALGSRSAILGVVGRDEEGERLIDILGESAVTTDFIHRSPHRPTSRKSRVIAQNQQMLRIDKEDSSDLYPDEERSLLDYLANHIPSYQALIIEDYGKGVVTESLVKAALDHAARQSGPASTFVDPCATRMKRYRGVHYATPNHHEAARAVGREARNERELSQVADDLLGMLAARGILITRGEHGMTLYRPETEPYHIPTRAREVFDVSGAGDTAVAVFAMAIGAGGTPEEAAHLANNAGGVVVGKFGVATVSPTELIHACRMEFREAAAGEC